ncbi:uncharacterized protein Dana_GF23068 [Drosophila ananassae]|uniref:Uncharacterized protein n=1 Tax=Drosophila ananassae TaxID=7217 RepID=B3MTS0_DROAN|nr:leucine-rich repeat-containing protein 15 [Drosophila ananassae]EDV30201.2 uncharacterized protein Dana_GF23068 [Drosophila ananassae]
MSGARAMYVRICLVAALAAIAASQDASKKFPKKEARISSLEDYCRTEGEVVRCSGFHFDREQQKATFDLQTEVRIAADGNTYEVGKEQSARTFVFENCSFVNFPLGLFYTLEISELDMRGCGIRHVHWENFASGAEKMAILLLADNEIHELPSKTFSGASSLQFLFLNRNRLSKLHIDSFENLGELQHLDLAENELEDLPPDVFSDLKSLQRVFLADNLLTIVAGDLFANNPLLFSVTLQRNRLEELEEYAFRPKGVGKEVAEHQVHSIDLSHNPRLKVLLLNLNVSHLYASNCSLDRVNLYGSVTTVDLSFNSVRELYFPASDKLEHLVLRNNSLVQLASLSRLPRLRHLDVADNPELGHLPEDWQTPQMEMLVLRNTGQEELPLKAIEGMPNLKKLDVSGNRITDLDPSSFPLLSQLTHFYIHKNSWNCFSLRAVLDVLIRPNGITYSVDIPDPDFPGEYLHGIACMYRIANKESMESSSSSEVAPESFEFWEKPKNYNAPSSEVEELRREFKVIVQHFDEKFDMAFAQLRRLNELMESIERLNQTVWNQVTLSV